MIEAYAFLAMFPLQILAMSVLYPAWFIRFVRARMKSFPAERFAQLFPGVDRNVSAEHFATRYRAANTVIAVLGLVLLGWLFGYMRRPDWHQDKVAVLAFVYFMAQMLPLGYVGWIGVRYRKALKRPEGKRTAVLQRRGLFDFVSPFMVFLAIASYLLFAAFVIYIEQRPFPGFGGLINIGGVTLVYALNAFVIYRWLYGIKRNPLLESHADRLHTIGWTVRIGVYSCIAVVVFISLNFTLVLLDLKRWAPFALSAFLVLVTILSSLGMLARPREPEADGLTPTGSS